MKLLECKEKGYKKYFLDKSPEKGFFCFLKNFS
nr:MAG TPA: hypothetical protein [Caudoviricetes sp.]